MGEIFAVFNNKTAIIEAMNKIGGAYISTNNPYWTSTQVNKDGAFAVHLGYGGNGSYGKGEKLVVRPVCSV